MGAKMLAKRMGRNGHSQGVLSGCCCTVYLEGTVKKQENYF
jgi:hypothetical protein